MHIWSVEVTYLYCLCIVMILNKYLKTFLCNVLSFATLIYCVKLIAGFPSFLTDMHQILKQIVSYKKI